MLVKQLILTAVRVERGSQNLDAAFADARRGLLDAQRVARRLLRSERPLRRTERTKHFGIFQEQLDRQVATERNARNHGARGRKGHSRSLLYIGLEPTYDEARETREHFVAA